MLCSEPSHCTERCAVANALEIMKKTISFVFLLLLSALILLGAASWFRSNPHELPVSLQPALAWLDRTQRQAQDQWTYWRDRMLGAPPMVAADSTERIAPSLSGADGASRAQGLPQVTLDNQAVAAVGVGPDGAVEVSGGQSADASQGDAPSSVKADPLSAIALSDTDALIAQADAAIARADAELARALAGEQGSAAAPTASSETTRVASPMSTTDSAGASSPAGPALAAAPTTDAALASAAGAGTTAATDVVAGQDTHSVVRSAKRTTVAEAANQATARLTRSAAHAGSASNPGSMPSASRALAEPRADDTGNAATNQTGASGSGSSSALWAGAGNAASSSTALAADASMAGQRPVAEEASALAALPPGQRRQVTAMLADPAAAARLPANLIVAPDAPQPPAPVSVDGRLQQDTIRHFLSGETVEFEVGRSVLTNRGRQALTALLDIIEQHRNTIITVQGHTDSVGDDESNLALSTARAITAREFLVARGVAPQRLRVQGFGERRPIASNATARGRIQNRRIDFTVSDR